MRGEIPMTSGDEHDALTHWRHYLHWKPGERKRIKRAFRRRVRRFFNRMLRREVWS